MDPLQTLYGMQCSNGLVRIAWWDIVNQASLFADIENKALCVLEFDVSAVVIFSIQCCLAYTKINFLQSTQFKEISPTQKSPGYEDPQAGLQPVCDEKALRGEDK